jgi:uncharacterized cupredoxin-like copper-binding protein
MRKLIVSVLAVAALAGFGVGVALATQSSATTKVTEKEWGVTPLPAKVKAGKVTFSVKNTGHLSHEFLVIKTTKAANKLPTKGAVAVVTGQVGKIAQFKPGVTKTLTLTLKPGHYVLICNLPAHYKAGQFANFTVG